MSNELDRPSGSVAEFSKFMDSFKKQIALALPAHMNSNRMARLALTAFSTTPALQQCSPRSIAASVMTAATLGLEPGVNGQGYLIPYKNTCTFVPGWKGLVDISNRAGRSTVWTGAVFQGDRFDFELGDSPFVRHQPGDEDHPDALTHVYAIGRSTGSTYPVIEVWTMPKIWKHREQYNKVGGKHYSYKHPEMYARKIPLLQVLKYMPSSIELSNAVAASNAAESGKGVIIDGDFITVDESGDNGQNDSGGRTDRITMTDDEFTKRAHDWRPLIESGRRSVNDLIAMIESDIPLTNDQKMIVASWAKGASK